MENNMCLLYTNIQHSSHVYKPCNIPGPKSLCPPSKSAWRPGAPNLGLEMTPIEIVSAPQAHIVERDSRGPILRLWGKKNQVVSHTEPGVWPVEREERQFRSRTSRLRCYQYEGSKLTYLLLYTIWCILRITISILAQVFPPRPAFFSVKVLKRYQKR